MTDPLSALEALQPWVKRITLIGYAGFGIFLLLSAVGKRIRVAVPSLPLKILVGCAIGLLWLWFTLHSYMFAASAMLGVAAFAVKEDAWRSKRLVLGGVAVVILTLSLTWWLTEYLPPTGWWRPATFALIVWCVQAGFLQRAERPHRASLPLMFLIFGLAGFALLANVTPYQPGTNALGNILHHQGAYIGPALQVRAGLVPLYDIPLQYGLGPTMAIAAVCSPTNCWAGMAFLMVSSTLLMGLLILRMALATRIERGTLWRVMAAVVIFTALFLWSGFAAAGSMPASLPSTGGLRFLPVTLLTFLLFFGKTRLASAVLVPAVLWSPETGIMALVVFGVDETARLGFVKAAIRTAAIVGGGILEVLVLHHAFYGVWIQPDVFTEYIRNVPAPYPINPISDYFFLVAALALAGWNVCRCTSDRLAFRQDLLTACLLFAASTYYLGRSHPNNICNLMPFIVLVVIRTLDGEAPAILPKLPRLVVLSLSVSVAALALSHWYYLPFAQGFSIDTNRIAAAAAQYDADMIEVRSHIPNPKHLGIADLAHWNRNPTETIVWTSMDPSVLFGEIPSARRQLYIRRSAARLRLPGWVIFNVDQQDRVNDFRVAYRVTEEGRYRIDSAISHQPETYVVAHLTPLDLVGRK